MAGSKNISVLYNKNENSFLKHVKSARTLDEEKIHKLRVSIKKMRSLLTFLEFLSGGKYNKKKISKLLSPVFKSAGKIRTAGLNIKLLHPFRSAGALRLTRYLKIQQKKQEKKLVATLGDFDKNKFIKLNSRAVKIFKEIKKEAVLKNSKNFVKDIFSDIKSEMPALFDDDRFHKVRKNLKNIKTIEQLIEEVYPNKARGSQLKKVKSVEQKIGIWHDKAILAEEMGKYILKQRSKKNRDPIKQTEDLEKLAMMVTGFKSENEKNKQLIAKQLERELI